MYKLKPGVYKSCAPAPNFLKLSGAYHVFHSLCHLIINFFAFFFFFCCPGSSLRLSLVAVSRSYSLGVVRRLLLWWLLFLQSTGSKAHRLSYSSACGIFLDQASNCVTCIGRWFLNYWATREASSQTILTGDYIL